jgi:hypothetical protein
MLPRSRTLAAATAIVALAVVFGPTGRAQQANQPAAPAKPDILVKVDVVLSRFQGEKKTSSLPFTLLVNTPGQGVNSASLRVGIDVPVGTTTSVRTVPDNTRDTNSATTATTHNNMNYRNVGTSIDARASQMSDGRLMIGVFVEDSSLFSDTAPGRASVRPSGTAFRTLSFGNTLPMRDGQTLEFASATDKVTGEVLKMDVTVTVVK